MSNLGKFYWDVYYTKSGIFWNLTETENQLESKFHDLDFGIWVMQFDPRMTELL